MPTIGDVLGSFVVEIGLDTSKFDEGRKKVADSLGKTKDEVHKSSKNIEDAGEKATLAIQGLAKEILALFGIFLSTQAVKKFVADISSADAALGRLAANIGLGVSHLGSYAAAAREAGQSPEAVVSTVAALNKAFRDLSLGQNAFPPELDAIFGRNNLKAVPRGDNIPIEDKIRIIEENLLALAKRDRGTAWQAAQLLPGMTQDYFNALIQSGKPIAGTNAGKFAPTDKDVKVSQDLQKAWADLMLTAESLGRAFKEKVGPELTDLFNKITGWLEKHGPDVTASLSTIFKNLLDILKEFTGWVLIENKEGRSGIERFFGLMAVASQMAADGVKELNKELKTFIGYWKEWGGKGGFGTQQDIMTPPPSGGMRYKYPGHGQPHSPGYEDPEWKEEPEQAEGPRPGDGGWWNRFGRWWRGGSEGASGGAGGGGGGDSGGGGDTAGGGTHTGRGYFGSSYVPSDRRNIPNEAGGGEGGGPPTHAGRGYFGGGYVPQDRRGLPGAPMADPGYRYPFPGHGMPASAAPGGGSSGGGYTPRAGASRREQMLGFAMDELRKQGVPEKNLRAAAAHLTGQAVMESGVNPTSVHDHGTGYGIYGAGKGRRDSMLSWMRVHGYPRDSLEGQTRYMAIEAMSGRYPKTKRILMNADPSTFGRDVPTVTREFEAPAVVNARTGAVVNAFRNSGSIEDRERVQQHAMGTNAGAKSTKDYTSPISGTFGGKEGSYYGAARSGGGRRHSGVDWQAASGSPALSMAPGRVLFTGNNQGYQWNVVVQHDDGTIVRYAVHGGVSVNVGDRVRQGQQIGTIGRGHLHLETIPRTLANGRPNPVYQQMITHPGHFVSTSQQHGTEDPRSVLGIPYGKHVQAGGRLHPGEEGASGSVYRRRDTGKSHTSEYKPPLSHLPHPQEHTVGHGYGASLAAGQTQPVGNYANSTTDIHAHGPFHVHTVQGDVPNMAAHLGDSMRHSGYAQANNSGPQ